MASARSKASPASLSAFISNSTRPIARRILRRKHGTAHNPRSTATRQREGGGGGGKRGRDKHSERDACVRAQAEDVLNQPERQENHKRKIKKMCNK